MRTRPSGVAFVSTPAVRRFIIPGDYDHHVSLRSRRCKFVGLEMAARTGTEGQARRPGNAVISPHQSGCVSVRVRCV